MNRYAIKNTDTGAVLGLYEADSREGAYAAMLADAGALRRCLRALWGETVAAGDEGAASIAAAAYAGDEEAMAQAAAMMLDGNPDISVREVPSTPSPSANTILDLIDADGRLVEGA